MFQLEIPVKGNMSTLKDLERVSNVVSAIMGYKSKNNEFRKPPSKVDVLYPTFCPKPMEREKEYKLIGFIKPLKFTTNENGYTLKNKGVHQKNCLIHPRSSTCLTHNIQISEMFPFNYKVHLHFFLYTQYVIEKCSMYYACECLLCSMV